MRYLLLILLLLTSIYSSTLEELDSIVNEATQEKVQKKKNLSDIFKQRMRTQLMARDAFLITTGYKKEFYIKELLDISKKFDRDIKKFTQNKKAIKNLSKKVPDYSKRIKRLSNTWSKFYKTIKTITQNSKDIDANRYIEQNNVLLLTDIDFILRKNIEFSESGDNFIKELQHANFMLFTQIGVPRTYIYKILKEKLLIQEEIDIIEYRQNLHITINALDRLLRAFVNGDKTLQLSGTRDKEFLTRLLPISKLWRELKPLYNKEVLTQEEFDTMIKKSDEFIVKHTQLVKFSNQIVDQ